MEKNIKIVLNQETPDERILVNLEDEFDNLEILSLKISNEDMGKLQKLFPKKFK